MKRTRTLKLALMGASALTLTACNNSTEVAVFENVDQCIDQAGFSRDVCEKNLEKAKVEHIRVAPKYTSASDCENDFGADRCEIAPQRTTSGGSVFMPLMMGYMMGNMLGGRSTAATQPLYRAKDDAKNFRTGDNQRVAGKTGLSKVSGQVARVPSTKMRTIRRGGFGATARSSMRRFRGFGGRFRSFGG